jgi:DNA repair exonuclease SbcCD ATPase subunit
VTPQGKGQEAKGKGQESKDKGRGQDKGGRTDASGPASIDELYQLPLSEFTPARNALAIRLRKSGKAGDADEVRSLVKPSIPAWAVNQVYWKHRPGFDRLLADGDRLRKAQSSTLAGKAGDVRGALESVRESLSELSRLAASELESAGHNPSPGVMRAVTATLEALSAYGTVANAPRAGRLVDEVVPPGFETLAALVPNAGGSSNSDTPSRVLQFQPHPPPAATRRSGADREERREEERRAKLAAAKAAVQDAEKNLREARSTAQDAQSALKKAAANAKDTERAMIEAEQVLDKAAKDAHSARQLARRLAAEAEAAAQAVEDAERALARAKQEVEQIYS